MPRAATPPVLDRGIAASKPRARSSSILSNSARSSRQPEDEFERRFLALIRLNDLVLDAGCGSGKFSPERSISSPAFHLVGFDNFAAVQKNTRVDFRSAGDVNHLPFADRAFDAVYARWLIEHLEDPATTLREFHRVMKPGGHLALFTTNIQHYYGVAARFTPHWFHTCFNRRRGFLEGDIFPTYYRANTRRRCERLLLEAGFKHENIKIELAEGAPAVLAFNSALHSLGRAYEYMVNRFESLSSFRLNLIIIARKE
jgi:ubiquinone/menaquinone biosynthesis C-methylase UbiE